MTSAYVSDIKKAAKANEHFRSVIFTAAKSQLVLMSLRPGEEIGVEVHDGDQAIYVVDGEGDAIVDGAEHEIGKGSIVFVPAGVRHNIVNTDQEDMKLFTVYAPPQHKQGAIQHRKEDEIKFEVLEEELAE